MSMFIGLLIKPILFDSPLLSPIYGTLTYTYHKIQGWLCSPTLRTILRKIQVIHLQCHKPPISAVTLRIPVTN